MRNYLRYVLLLLAGCFGCVVEVSAATLSFTFTDENSEFATRGWMNEDSAFQRNFRAAGVLVGNLIASDVDIRVQVKPDLTAARFLAAMHFGRYVETRNGFQLWEASALSRTIGQPGSAPFDITVWVNPVYVGQWYWVDPQPETRATPVPLGKTDLVSIVMHEIVHGLGVTGRRSRDSASYGSYLDIARTSYDLLTSFAGSGAALNADGSQNILLYAGPEARLVHGADLPLTFLPRSHELSSQNFSHIGDCSNPTLALTLMSGCYVPIDGRRMKFTPYDVALLADIGYPIRSVFYPASGTLMVSVVVAGARYSAKLALVDAVAYEFELRGAVVGNRPSSDATYNPAAGELVLSNLVLNDTPNRYAATLTAVAGMQPLRFRLKALTRLP